MMKINRITTLFLSFLLLSGCATIDPQTGERKDSFENFNRAMWNFNYKFADPYLLKPVAKVWKNYIPQPIRTTLTNVANNLDEPAAFVNRLLEGDLTKAMTHFNRFWINSIFGLGGMIDWASYSDSLKIENTRRFGDTLGYYGVDTGSYVMLPFYGAATPRQDLGNLVDNAYPVYSLLGPWMLLKYGIQSLDKRAALLDKETLLHQAQDPYVTFREGYFQSLDYRIHNGKVSAPQHSISEDILEEID